MSGAATAQATAITLKGSVEIVSEFFGERLLSFFSRRGAPRHATSPAGHCINSILYQRGIYPPETFTRVSQYGLTMFKTEDPGLNAYLDNVLRQLTCAPNPRPAAPRCARLPPRRGGCVRSVAVEQRGAEASGRDQQPGD